MPAGAPAPAPARAAWLFPGQGAEAAGALRAGPGPVGRLVERAGRALGVDLAHLIAAGDPRLGRTEIAQPALVAVCLEVALRLEARGHVPDAVAGHSLGELAAAAVAGCLSAEEAVDLAVERGRLMADGARAHPGAMAAVRAPDREAVERLVRAGRAQGRLTVAARNTPGQWVLSGDRSALDAVAAVTPVTLLPTSGAWHSDAMAGVEARWRDVLGRVRFRAPRRPLVANHTGRLVEAGDDVAALLGGQLTRPIAWVETLEALAGMGVTRFIAVGPGKALRGFCRETLGPACEVALASGEETP